MIHLMRVELRGAGVIRGGRRILTHADLVLEPGRLTVVVTDSRGRDDATTLLDVVAGLAPAEGSVRHDGVDVRRLGDDAVASSVAVVTRRPFLTAGSIRDNVTLGAVPDEAELSEALRIAALPDDGAPARYRGQIGLARAVLRRPRLLVLDDATAGLDADVERQIFEGLAGLDLTVLATTARPGPYADQIVFLNENRITVIGRHDAAYESLVHAPAAADPIGV